MVKFISFDFGKIFSWDSKRAELQKYGNGSVQAEYAIELLTGDVFPKSGSYELKLRVMEYAEAKFLNLFGVFIDTKSFNIAFGLFPSENSYIFIPKDNFRSLFEKYIFFDRRNANKKERDNLNLDDIDYKYILEVLKLKTLSEAGDTIFDYLVEYFSNVEYIPGSEYNSIVMNLVSSYEAKVESIRAVSDKAFLHRDSFDDRFYRFVKSVYEIGISFNSLAKFFLWPFIAEDDYVSVRENRIKEKGNILKKSLESRDASLERTYEIYLSKKVPYEFINACVSYGFGIKSRENIYRADLSRGYSTNKDNLWKILSGVSGKASSMSYVIDPSSFGSKGDSVMSLCFNIIDLIRCVGWLNSLLYSVDMIKVYKNRTLYDSIIDKMKVREILEENLVSEVDFVKALNKYLEFYELCSSGSMYKMPVKNKFNFASFTSRQLDNIGPVLDSSMRLILKKFPKAG